MNNQKILSKGWKLLALNEICDLQNGYAFKSNDYVNISNTLNCRMSNIRPDGFFDIEHNQKFLPDSYIEKYKQYLLKDGDVIIAMTDMATEAKILGVPTIVETQGKNLLLNQRVGKLIIKKSELINFPYLKYALNREQVKNYFLKFAGGGLQINLGKEDILSVEIPLPPIAEQKRIAEILDRTQSLISKRKEAIAKLDTITQSIFLEMFGDPEKNPKGWIKYNLSKISIFENGDRSSNYPSGDDIQEQGILFLSTKNIVNDRLNLSIKQFITGEKFKSLSRGKAKKDDLLITLRGTLGSCCIFSSEYETAFINAQMMIIRTKNDVSPVFLHSFLTSDFFKQKIKSIGRGAAVLQLTATQLADISIPVPPLDLQKEFAQRIEAVENLKATHRASLSELQALFASLQHRAFRGEL